MKGKVTSLIFISFLSLASVAQAGEVPGSHFEGTLDAIKTLETPGLLAAARDAGIAFFKSIPGFASQGYTALTEYAKENPGKSAALVTAAVVVPTAIYFAVKKAFNYWKNRA